MCVPSAVMRQEVASVDNRVTEGFVWIINADLGTDAPANTFSTTCFHLIEVSEIIFDSVLSVCGSDSLEALVSHLAFHHQI
jgi:hypothetical protein